MARDCDVFLASGSPRRGELLRQLGVAFSPLTVQVDERPLPAEPVQDYVRRLAELKASSGWRALEDRARLPVIGADTAVSIDGDILGKPSGPAEAADMLLRLGGRVHTVLTAVALRSAAGMSCRLSRSEVEFRPIGSVEAAAYWRTGEPVDKAGGYAIQGFGAAFVRRLEGSYSGVVGLPLFETAELLTEAGVPRWHQT